MGGYSAFILRRPGNEDSFSFIAFTLPSTRYTLLAIRPLVAALDSSTPASFAAFVFPRNANHVYLGKEVELQDVILTSCVRAASIIPKELRDGQDFGYPVCDAAPQLPPASVAMRHPVNCLSPHTLRKSILHIVVRATSTGRCKDDSLYGNHLVKFHCGKKGHHVRRIRSVKSTRST